MGVRIGADVGGTLTDVVERVDGTDASTKVLTTRDAPERAILDGLDGRTISEAIASRPRLDGLTSTAFPSGVRTMSVEATEQVGSIVIWRKEIRPDSGGAGDPAERDPAAIENDRIQGHVS